MNMTKFFIKLVHAMYEIFQLPFDDSVVTKFLKHKSLIVSIISKNRLTILDKS